VSAYHASAAAAISTAVRTTMTRAAARRMPATLVSRSRVRPAL
jgi:hypothetical protein